MYFRTFYCREIVEALYRAEKEARGTWLAPRAGASPPAYLPSLSSTQMWPVSRSGSLQLFKMPDEIFEMTRFHFTTH